jgi:hypothetical protein
MKQKGKMCAVFCICIVSFHHHIISYSEFDADNELDDPALLDAVVNDSSDEDDNITQEFVWENVQNYKRQKEKCMGSVGPQGAAKHVTNCFVFGRALSDMTVKETNRYMDWCLCGHELSTRLPDRPCKPVTEGEIYVVLGLFMHMGIIQKPTLRSYFTTKE